MPVFKFIPRFQQHLVAPYTFRYDKSSLMPRMMMLGLLTLAIVILLPTEALAVDGELKTQVESIEKTLTALARPALLAVTIGSAAVCIYKQNVPGFVVSAVGAVATFLLKGYITDKYALVL